MSSGDWELSRFLIPFLFHVDNSIFISCLFFPSLRMATLKREAACLTMVTSPQSHSVPFPIPLEVRLVLDVHVHLGKEHNTESRRPAGFHL